MKKTLLSLLSVMVLSSAAAFAADEKKPASDKPASDKEASSCPASGDKADGKKEGCCGEEKKC